MAEPSRSLGAKKLAKLAGRFDAAEVVPLLFIGSLASSHDSSFFKAKNIRTIVNASNMNPERLFWSPYLREIFVPVSDAPGSDILQYFDTVGQKIDEAMNSQNAVLVHCAAGISRSASLVLAYLMKYRNMNLKEAHSLLKSKRRIVRPNIGFWKQLIDYEFKLFGTISVKMITCPAVQADGGNGKLAVTIPDIYEEEYKNMVL